MLEEMGADPGKGPQDRVQRQLNFKCLHSYRNTQADILTEVRLRPSRITHGQSASSEYRTVPLLSLNFCRQLHLTAQRAVHMRKVELGDRGECMLLFNSCTPPLFILRWIVQKIRQWGIPILQRFSCLFGRSLWLTCSYSLACSFPERC